MMEYTRLFESGFFSPQLHKRIQLLCEHCGSCEISIERFEPLNSKSDNKWMAMCRNSDCTTPLLFVAKNAHALLYGINSRFVYVKTTLNSILKGVDKNYDGPKRLSRGGKTVSIRSMGVSEQDSSSDGDGNRKDGNVQRLVLKFVQRKEG